MDGVAPYKIGGSRFEARQVSPHVNGFTGGGAGNDLRVGGGGVGIESITQAIFADGGRGCRSRPYGRNGPRQFGRSRGDLGDGNGTQHRGYDAWNNWVGVFSAGQHNDKH